MLVASPAIYYASQSAREKGEPKEEEQWAHAANCMRDMAAPGAFLFFQECGYHMPQGLDPREMGKATSNGERGSVGTKPLTSISAVCEYLLLKTPWICGGTNVCVCGMKGLLSGCCNFWPQLFRLPAMQALRICTIPQRD